MQLPSRGIQTEEEILLLYDIVETHGKPEDFEKLVSSEVFGPLKQFKQGRKTLFLRVIAKHRRDHDWESIFRLCKECLSQDDEEGRPSLLASDFNVWEEFINAASYMKNADET